MAQSHLIDEMAHIEQLNRDVILISVYQEPFRLTNQSLQIGAFSCTVFHADSAKFPLQLHEELFKNVHRKTDNNDVVVILTGITSPVISVRASQYAKPSIPMTNVAQRFAALLQKKETTDNNYHLAYQIFVRLTSNSIAGDKENGNYIPSVLDNIPQLDVLFYVQGQVMKAHKVVLAFASPVFAAMFQHDLQRRPTTTVIIKDIRPEVFDQFLKYLYVGKAPKLGEDGMALDLLIVAEKYAVDNLKQECVHHFRNNICVENAVPTLIVAHVHKAVELYKNVLTFITLNALAVCSRSDWLTLMKDYPELCFEATQLMMRMK